jgi:nitrate/nitrite transport system ATP-binding protein
MSERSLSEQGPLLRVQGVSQAFDTPAGRVLALDRINLDVSSGELVVLIGHSGCGKSTLLNIVAGLLAPTAGAALFDDRPIAGPGPERAVVFQNYSLLPWLSVYDNVFVAVDSAEPGLGRKEKQELTRRFLKVVGLAGQAQKRPHQLSGGMRQRVAVARAFAVHPRLLLLDEPFGALDALTRSTLQDELLKIWSLESRTESVLMVTHDVDEAIYLADRIMVMTNGPAATVGEVLTVNLERPRDKRGMMHTPEYADLKDRLLYLLTVAHARDVA